MKRSKDKVIFGICGGIAEYFNVKPNVVRFAVAICACFDLSTILWYFLANYLLPKD